MENVQLFIGSFALLMLAQNSGVSIRLCQNQSVEVLVQFPHMQQVITVLDS
jgi:hypothetical protein